MLFETVSLTLLSGLTKGYLPCFRQILLYPINCSDAGAMHEETSTYPGDEIFGRLL